MGIKDLAGKLVDKVKGRVSGEDDDFGDEDLGSEDLGLEEPVADDLDMPSLEPGPAPATAPSPAPVAPVTPIQAPTPAEAPAPAPEPEEEPPASSDAVDAMKTELDSIRNKLEALDVHISTIESKAEYQKTEAERYMQYLTLINEKLDHLEQEHSEIERLVQKKE